MVDAVDLGRVGVDPLLVDLDRVGLPAALPELVDDLHEVVGHVVALVVRNHRPAERRRRRLRGAGRHDVPAHPAVGDLVDGREPARERVRLLDERGRSDHEADVLRLRYERRGDDRGVKARKLETLDRADLRPLAVDVGPAPGVREEQEVQLGVLADSRDLGPVAQAVEVVALILGVAPERGSGVVGLGIVE